MKNSKTSKPRVPPLVREIVEIADELTRDRPAPYWVSMWTVARRLSADSDSFRSAVTWGVKYRLLTANGDNMNSITVTASGVRLAKG